MLISQTTRAYLLNSYVNFIIWLCMYGLYWFPFVSISSFFGFCSAPSLSFSLSNCLFWIQADVETDEVYAQMTLQPLNPVWYTVLPDNWFCSLYRYIHSLVFDYDHVCSKSKRRHTFQQSWALRVNSQQTTSARLWLLVIQVLMGDSLCLAGRLKKCFLHW